MRIYITLKLNFQQINDDEILELRKEQDNDDFH